MAYHALPISPPTMPEFQRFDPTDCHFPSPRMPLLPSLRWNDITFGSEDTTTRDVSTGPGVRHFARGRYAMHAAYHCRTMLDPALALGGAFALYLLNADLTPQLVSIKALVAQHSPRITALVVTHYLA
jgi:perosamine synthetase